MRQINCRYICEETSVCSCSPVLTVEMNMNATLPDSLSRISFLDCTGTLGYRGVKKAQLFEVLKRTPYMILQTQIMNLQG